jgi:S1-C subfamily serine protease
MRYFWVVAVIVAVAGTAQAQAPSASSLPAQAVVYCYDKDRGVVQRLLRAECRGTIVNEAEAQAITGRREEQLKRAFGSRQQVGRGGLRRASIGTGFYVDEVGRVATSYRVVSDCTALTVVGSTGTEQSAIELAVDMVRDMALLRVDTLSPARPYFSTDDNPNIGMAVTIVGYPAISSTTMDPVIAPGTMLVIPQAGAPTEEVVIRANLRESDRGAPVLDSRGLVIGMVIGGAELDAVQIGSPKNQTPPNSVRAVPLSPLTDFLQRYDTRYRVAEGGAALGVEQTSARARDFVVRVDCWK